MMEEDGQYVLPVDDEGNSYTGTEHDEATTNHQSRKPCRSRPQLPALGNIRALDTTPLVEHTVVHIQKTSPLQRLDFGFRF